MKFKGLENITGQDLKRELDHGARFVIYTYTISVILMTFKRSSDIYFIKSNESGLSKSLPFSLISLFFGWWGLPWGPVYTIGSLFSNFSGGENVTIEVMSNLSFQDQTGITVK